MAGSTNGERDRGRPIAQILYGCGGVVKRRDATVPVDSRGGTPLGVEQIELHTGEYAHAFGHGRPSSLDWTKPIPEAARPEHARLAAAAKRGHELGLEVAAGHGLTTRNVGGLVLIQEIVELNIGHAVIADAVFLSLTGAVKAMLGAIAKGRPA